MAEFTCHPDLFAIKCICVEGIYMQVIVVENKKQQKEFLEFRRNLYLSAAKYVGNNYFMLQEVFGRKLHFVKTVELKAVNA